MALSFRREAVCPSKCDGLFEMSFFQFDTCDQNIKIYRGSLTTEGNRLGTFCDGNTPGYFDGNGHLTFDFSDITDSTNSGEFHFRADREEGEEGIRDSKAIQRETVYASVPFDLFMMKYFSCFL